MPADNLTVLVGNLTDDPELRYTPNGVAVANFRLAFTPRIKDANGWRDGETSFIPVNVWRDPAEHVTQSLHKGDRAIVAGRLRTRTWETDAGDKRTVTELDADEVGASLRFHIVKDICKPHRSRNTERDTVTRDDPVTREDVPF